ncbi:hypothetical protein OF83DRAFT_1087966 [Amylostereum chailletii]|nr:hypothetical protein OF83DRAFT_1087966 [Amylostereum chailletii]
MPPLSTVIVRWTTKAPVSTRNDGELSGSSNRAANPSSTSALPTPGPSSSAHGFEGDFFGADYMEGDFAWSAEDDEAAAEVSQEGPPDSDGDSVVDDEFDIDVPDPLPTINVSPFAMPNLFPAASPEPMEEEPGGVPMLNLDVGAVDPAHEQMGMDDLPVKIHRFGGAAGATLDDPIHENTEDGFVRYEQTLNVGGPAVNPYYPFPTRMDWEVGRWAKLRGPGSTALTELLSIEGSSKVADKLRLSYKNTRELHTIVDSLPSRPAFVRHQIDVDGEVCDVYLRDAMECVRALYGAPEFASELIVVPERQYADLDETVRVYSDMHTARWWWNVQYPAHTDIMLQRLSDALTRFHVHKAVFVDLGIREHFNFPKMHSLTHYAPSVKLFGTADNFNTSYTERLHIDFTKDAYRSTNRKDEYSQMTLWLQRREKIHRHELFVAWHLAEKPAISTISPPHIPRMYLKIARIPNIKVVSFATATARYGASQLATLFKEYIVRQLYPTLTAHQRAQIAATFPLPFDHVAVFHKLKFWNPDALGRNNVLETLDCVHARAAYRDEQGCQIPARFDTALVQDEDPDDERTGVHKLHISQIRMIFTLSKRAARAAFPARHAGEQPTHFAYIEWFSHFPTHPNPNHLMYTITRSFRGQARRAGIIPLNRIVRSVHLSPKFGPVKPPSWTSANVLELCNTFHQLSAPSMAVVIAIRPGKVAHQLHGCIGARMKVQRRGSRAHVENGGPRVDVGEVCVGVGDTQATSPIGRSTWGTYKMSLRRGMRAEAPNRKAHARWWRTRGNEAACTGSRCLGHGENSWSEIGVDETSGRVGACPCGQTCVSFGGARSTVEGDMTEMGVQGRWPPSTPSVYTAEVTNRRAERARDFRPPSASTVDPGFPNHNSGSYHQSLGVCEKIRVRFIWDSDCVVTVSPAKWFALDGGASTPVNAPQDGNTADTSEDEKSGNKKGLPGLSAGGCDTSNCTDCTALKTVVSPAKSESPSAPREEKECGGRADANGVATNAINPDMVNVDAVNTNAISTISKSHHAGGFTKGSDDAGPISFTCTFGWSGFSPPNIALRAAGLADWQELSRSKDSEEDLAEDGESQRGDLEED